MAFESSKSKLSIVNAIKAFCCLLQCLNLISKVFFFSDPRYILNFEHNLNAILFWQTSRPTGSSEEGSLNCAY